MVDVVFPLPTYQPRFSSRTCVRHLSLSRNALSGTIPSTLSELTSLVLLQLDSNGLSGAVPVTLSACISLTYATCAFPVCCFCLFVCLHGENPCRFPTPVSCVCVCLPVCLPVCLSVCLSVCWSVWQRNRCVWEPAHQPVLRCTGTASGTAHAADCRQSHRRRSAHCLVHTGCPVRPAIPTAADLPWLLLCSSAVVRD